jgi:germination protein M
VYIYGVCLIVSVFAYLAPGLFTHSATPSIANSMSVNLYFLNPVSNTLQKETRNIETPSSNTLLIQAALTELINGPAAGGLYRTIPRDITIIDANLAEEQKLCEVNLSPEYYDLPVKDQIFCRSSLVWSLTEFDFIDDVLIYVSKTHLTNASGQTADIMNRENMTLNPELLPVRINSRTLTLYFADENGVSLASEERTVEVSGNIEYHIVEQLILGPKDENLSPALLPDLRLKDASTADGICYVDFGSEFLTRQLTGGDSDMIALYSIVNSLTELTGIQKVQIIVDSATINASVNGIDLSMPVGRDGFGLTE